MQFGDVNPHCCRTWNLGLPLPKDFLQRRKFRPPERERKVYYKIATNRDSKKMIMMMKTLGSQKGSLAAAEEEAEGRGGGTGEGGERK